MSQTQTVICQVCNKRPATGQISQIVNGRQYFVNICDQCLTELQQQAEKTSNLDKFTSDLTQSAREGRLDPVIGREDEIERLVHILSRRTKNNPVLIGDPGVGKTAIVEGLAQRIVSHEIPETLEGKRVLSLDISGMLAGASHRGEFEDRLKKSIEEVKQAKGQIILFIDELHLVVGAGKAEGAIDAANMLKPALARGELQAVGATTLDEYRKYIEKDAALERRFQPIIVKESTVEDTVLVLQGLRKHYENHHKVKITDSAIEAASEMSDRYIQDRFLPDKAIDLIDEACVRVKLQKVEKPENLKQVEEEMEKIKKLEARNQKLKELEKVKEELTQLWLQSQEKSWPEVTREDVAEIVSKATGIPVKELSEEEKEKLLKLEKRIHERIINQDEAVQKIAESIRRSRAGLQDVNRPIGSFIFAGPTGVGKTELTKALCEVLYGSQELMIRIDMSEYQEKFEVSRLIGAPPGYVGYEEAGQLTEKVRRNPFSVILLDEIEKAHPQVFNILLQILDDGRLTDGQGKTINFKNTILIMTSNLQTEDEMKSNFRPEFINRVDEIIYFGRLSKKHVRQIVDLLLNETERRLQEQQITLKVSDKVRDKLGEEGYDEVYGARPMKRLIQRTIENPLSTRLISGKVKSGDIVTIELKGNDFVIE